MSYENWNEDDKRMVIEARLLNIFTDKKYGGKRIVEGPLMSDMQKKIVDEIYKMRDEGLLWR